MPIQSIDPKYGIRDVPGFEKQVFTESSHDILSYPDAVKFCADHNAVLWSMQEAAVFRIEAQQWDHADERQASRTVAVYLMINRSPCVAFDDVADPKKNVGIAYAKIGYTTNQAGKELLIPLRNQKLKDMLQRAEKQGRIHKLPEKNLELTLNKVRGNSEFGQNNIVQAILGSIAEPYADYLRKKNKPKGYVWLPHPEYVEKQAQHTHTIVRPLWADSRSLGYNIYANYYFANIDFDYLGFARGVRGAQEFIAAK